MAEMDIAAAKKVVFKGLILLGVITLIEVLIALVGNGHIIEGFHLPKWLMYPAMIGLSAYKAYFIIFEFMHMRYEVSGLMRSVLLPTALLIWAVIAFLQEGNSWKERRAQVSNWNAVKETQKIPDQPAPATKEIAK